MPKIAHKDPVIRAFMLFMQLAQAAYKYSDRSFYYGSDVTTATFVALKGLAMTGGLMTHSQLADWTNTEKHNITSLVDRMKKDGFVTTAYSKEDRRVIDIQITDKGKKAFAAASPLSQNIMLGLMRGIGPEDATRFEKLLKVMKTNIERESRSLKAG
jgi:MarR family transcriptional regulator for hemolysin